MQENGYCMYIMITSDYRFGCFCDDLSYYTVSPCFLLLQGNVNFFCVNDCKRVWNVSWFAREAYES